MRAPALAGSAITLLATTTVLAAAMSGTAHAGPLPVGAQSIDAPSVDAQSVGGASARASSAITLLPSPGADLTRLPVGDTKVTLTGARANWEWACTAGNPDAPGAVHTGPWIHGDTWSVLDKPAVRGSVSWKSQAQYAEQSGATTRTITTMRVPTIGTTGTFPIAPSDPAATYDRNPNAVVPRQKVISLTRYPVKAARPSCLPMGAIGVAKNGVMLYNALDARNMDARAHEMQDSCEGHPNHAEYHYHAGSACVVGSPTTAAPNSAVLFGYAFDGFGIYVERDATGALLTNRDLDSCHGRTSKVLWNGTKQSIYHYVVTQEFPYLLGCFAGTNTVPPPAGPVG